MEFPVSSEGTSPALKYGMMKVQHFGERNFQARIENLANMRIMGLAIGVILPVTLVLMEPLVICVIARVLLVVILITQEVLMSVRHVTEAQRKMRRDTVDAWKIT